jgi:hypothetical protein
MVGTYTPLIAPLEVPVSDCGMGLNGAEASTAGRNEVWGRGVVGGKYSALPNWCHRSSHSLDREGASIGCCALGLLL